MLYTLLTIIFFIVIYVFLYNRLVNAKQNAHEAFAGIDVQLKRRYDLIPNLIQTVKGYATHEETLFQHIAKSRAQALNIAKKDIQQKAGIEKDIDSSLKSLFAIAEAYPDLKANEQYLKLQQQLAETEDQIASARRIYNANVTDYNTLISSFPVNIAALVHRFKALPLFQNS